MDVQGLMEVHLGSTFRIDATLLVEMILNKISEWKCPKSVFNVIFDKTVAATHFPVNVRFDLV